MTGLAFDDMPGTVVFMALGYSVDLLAHVPWTSTARCLYWGDIDTHGFAILQRARACFPRLESVLMDLAVATLGLNARRAFSGSPLQDAARRLAASLPREPCNAIAVFQGIHP